MSAICAGVEDEDSVYTLVTSLCKNLLEKNEPLLCVASKHSNVEADLKKLRALSFGILLGKAHQNGMKILEASYESPVNIFIACPQNQTNQGRFLVFFCIDFLFCLLCCISSHVKIRLRF